MSDEAGVTAMGWVVLAPLLGALVAFVRPRFGGAVSLVTFVVVAALVATIGADVRDGQLLHPVGGWGAPLGIDLRADGIAVAMLATTALVGALVGVNASGYFASNGTKGERQAAYYWPAWLLLWTGLNALFLAGDIFNLYVTLELVALTAVTLVALGGSTAALAGATRYLFIAVVGAICYLVGVELVYATYATLDLAGLARVARSDVPTTAALALMTAGLLLKTALVPLHFWLPPAHASAPAPCSAILSALVVKAAFFVLVRLWGWALAAAVTPAATWLLGALGAAAIIWGSVMALRVERLKMLVAYSTVAQLGYLFMAPPLALAAGAGTRAWAAATYFVMAHATAKSAMFLAVGSLSRLTNGDRLAELRGIGTALPVATAAFVLSGMSLMGLPPTGGFVAKWLLLESSLASGAWWWAVFVAGGGLLTAGYLFRVLKYAFLDPAPVPVTSTVADRSEHRLIIRGDWAALALAISAVALGLAAPTLLPLLGSAAAAAGADVPSALLAAP